jgi:hypothetical protein
VVISSPIIIHSARLFKYPTARITHGPEDAVLNHQQGGRADFELVVLGILRHSMFPDVDVRGILHDRICPEADVLGNRVYPKAKVLGTLCY